MGSKRLGFVTAEFGEELSGQIYGENVTLEFGEELCGLKKAGFVTAEFGGELSGLKKAGVRDRRVLRGTEWAQKGWGS